MIVCICNNVSDRKIRQAVDSGMTSMVELRNHLEVGTCCGKCHASAKSVLRKCLAGEADAAHRHPQFAAQQVFFQRDMLAAA
jgi:bacterioferritin-associated ferredoxin